MALTCPTDLSGVSLGFTEFIDCDSVSINLDRLGVATVSFTVISVSDTPNDVNAYTDLVFGGVNFTGFISNLEVSRIPGTLVFQHNYTINGIGCRV
jgi:hypothetical protein